MIQKLNYSQVNGGKGMWNLKKGTKLSTCSDWNIQQWKWSTGNDIKFNIHIFPWGNIGEPGFAGDLHLSKANVKGEDAFKISF